MQYRNFVFCSLNHLLHQNSDSLAEYISYRLYCMKPVLAAVCYQCCLYLHKGIESKLTFLYASKQLSAGLSGTNKLIDGISFR
jgi:hypothetical protein